ncbi:hypothetical protein N7468_007582 [Penicillium chermesinum]|uniref:Major facilitator superfamily (MFS) profile domain-containing protein n=1 Tax=Penicillium chermesinum TaxID=63820 RepID=A0A9W9NUN9_9EURO|nr:uncharacterized protein N7468_007582 [Penicillium chermesinum]KAJ5226357.1 hypothetical protein N7468_007582 [Penicillium chermesinum]
MAGGTSIWISNEAKTDPKAIFNLRLLFLLVSVAWGGSFYGFDTGNIGGILTLPSFQNAFGLNKMSQNDLDDRKGTIASMLAAGGSAGALLAAPTSDYLGRKWSVFGWGFVFVIGAAMQMVADYDVLLGGRFVAGMGVGASSMLTPQFLAENSPQWDWPGVEHDDTQWRTAMGIQIIPGALMCLMIPFVPETPRWLINHGRSEQGLKNICKLRKLPADHEYIQTEFSEIEAQVRHEQECFAGHSYWVVMKDIFTSRNNFQRFFLAVMLFLFHKFTGTDSINYYAPEIFDLIGVSGGSTTLLDTGIYGVVKTVTTIFYVGYLVDRIGRRVPLLVGATMQATCMLYLALYLRFADTSATTVGGTPAGGIVGIVAIYIYAFGNIPTRIRSFCMAFCFFINWIVDYGITRATPNMITEMGWGVFLLYAMLTYLGVIFIYFCLPEMKGRSIESMDNLFERPLWTMWRHAYPTEEEKVRSDVLDNIVTGKQDDDAKRADVEHLETA